MALRWRPLLGAARGSAGAGALRHLHAPKVVPRKKSHALDLVDRIIAKRVGRVGFTPDFYAVPRRAGAEAMVKLLRRIIYPGIFGDNRVHDTNLKYYLGILMFELKELLEDQVTRALLHGRTDGPGKAAEECARQAKVIAAEFLALIPRVRGQLALDIAACVSGDPAAKSEEEVILCYPGFEAIFIHRFAHELAALRVPFLPRIMASYAHQRTAIDIHPGARIGSAIFMDHGTGIVIGETTVIGRNVKLFHGVTLGAHSFEKGQDMAGVKRHPTIEDDVTIYAGAVILGGDTVIGSKAVIGGSLWVTSSVPAGHVVYQPPKGLSVVPVRSKVDPFEAWDPCI